MPRIDGIDIAHYQWDQGPVDLAAVHAIPTFWFATKATQSTAYVDPTFAKARAAAHAAGFTHIGLYHWLSSTTDPVAQADHFLATIGPLQPGEFVMGDFEEAGITAAGCLAFNERVESRTRRPVVGYSGLYVSGGTIWRSAPLRASVYGVRPFIVAAYVSEANLDARMKATGSLPNFPRDGWQFASGGIMPNGAHIPGIVGRCDEDQIDNRPAFDVAAGVNADTLPPAAEGDFDMIITNGDTSGTFGPQFVSKWAFDPVRWVKRALPPTDWTAIGSPVGQPMSDTELARINDYTPENTGAVDSTARAQIVALNDSVGRLGQRQSAAGKDLADAGAALQGT